MRLWLKIGLALAAGGSIIVGFQLFMDSGDVALASTTSGGPRPLSVEPSEDTAAAGRGELLELTGQAMAFELATQAAALPQGCAPVLRIARGGQIQVAVAPPLARTPGPLRWAKVGVLMPCRDLRFLSASERSSLLAIWSHLAPGTLGRERVHLNDCRLQEVALIEILKWKLR